MNQKQDFLSIEDLHAEVDGKPILKGVHLHLHQGEVHAIMGPNGSGKSTLANIIMGHPKYVLTKGSLTFKGENLATLSPDARAKRGIFLGMQYPTAIPGVPVSKFLRMGLKVLKGSDIPVAKFIGLMKDKMSAIGITDNFAGRYINDGFSGGEKKRHEILQLSLFEPAMAILDEPDSGLDIDTLKVIAQGINATRHPEKGLLLITHYQRILNFVRPDFIHVMSDGRIIKSGGPEIAEELEAKGYEWISKDAGIAKVNGGPASIGNSSS